MGVTLAIKFATSQHAPGIRPRLVLHRQKCLSPLARVSAPQSHSLHALSYQQTTPTLTSNAVRPFSLLFLTSRRIGHSFQSRLDRPYPVEPNNPPPVKFQEIVRDGHSTIVSHRLFFRHRRPPRSMSPRLAESKYLQ